VTGLRIRRRISARALALSCGLVSIVLAGAPVVASGQPASPAAAPTVASSDALPLESDAISQRIDAVKSDSALDPARRDEAISAYTAALDFVRSAETWEFKTGKYGRLVEEAAGHQKRLHSLTETPVAAPTPGANDASADLATLEQRALEFRVLLGEKRAELDEIASEQQRRATRRLEIPTRQSEVRRRLAELRVETAAAETVASSEPGRARYTRSQAEIRAYERESDALDAEIASYDARRELLPLRRDVATREIGAIQVAYQALQATIDAKRKTEAETAAEVASGAAEQARAEAHPILRAAAEANAALAAARTGSDGIVNRLERARAFAARIDAREDRLTREFDAIQERARIVGFSGPIGALLRKHKQQLPDRAWHREKIRERQDEIGQVQLRLLELEDERATLADPSAAATAAIREAEPSLAGAELDAVARELTQLFETKRRYLDTLLADYDAHFFTLVELDTKERDLVEQAAKFSRYIDEHVLWIRSATPLGWASIGSAAEALAWLVRPETGTPMLDEWRSVLRGAPLSVLLVLVFLGVLFVARQRLQRYVLAQPDPTASTASIRPLTLEAAAAVLAAARWPAIMYSAGWIFSKGVGDHARAIGTGLESIAWFFFVFEFARQVFRKQGIAPRYFGWSPRAVEGIRRYVTTAMVAGLPAAFVVNAIHTQPNDVWKESLGRIAFLVTILSLGVLSYRLMRREGPIIGSIAEGQRGYSWLYRSRGFIGPAALAVCVVLAVLAVFGYYFAALVIGPVVGQTLVFGFALTLIQALILVWLRVMHGGPVAVGAASTSPSSESARGAVSSPESGDGATAAIGAIPAAPAASSGVSDRDRRVLSNATAFAFLVGAFFIWRGFLPALNVVTSYELWRATEQHTYEVATDAGSETRTGARQIPITLGNVLEALLVVAVAIAAARHVPGFLELALKRRLRMDSGVANAVRTLAGYSFVLFGVVSSMSTLGLSWGQVQWLAAAVSVGLGFGLQEIFANFVSGLILLFERPIRLGDIVTLGNITGTVARIQIRATTIIDPDRKELIVPNKEFVTGQLINWTLTDTVLRLTIPVGISYGADTKLAEKILLETARKNPNVLDDPPPTITFSSFGDSSLQFDVRVFIPHPEYVLRTRHMLHMQIEEALRAAGIEIPFPQRDLHIRSVAAPAALKIES
jgi:potassium efflux system protein